MSTIFHPPTSDSAHGREERADQPAATTVVLLDPTADDGERGLDAIGDGTTHVAIVVLLSGPHSTALHEFARAEEIDLMTAGWHYLEQVESRIRRHDLAIETVVAAGPDLVAELELIAFERSVERIVVPPSAGRTARRRVDRLSEHTGVPIVVADAVAAAPG